MPWVVVVMLGFGMAMLTLTSAARGTPLPNLSPHVEQCRAQHGENASGIAVCLARHVSAVSSSDEVLALQQCAASAPNDPTAISNCLAGRLSEIRRAALPTAALVQIPDTARRMIDCVTVSGGERDRALTCALANSQIPASSEAASAMQCAQRARGDRVQIAACLFGEFGERVLPENFQFIARCMRESSSEQPGTTKASRLAMCISNQGPQLPPGAAGDVQACFAQSGGEGSGSAVAVCFARRRGLVLPPEVRCLENGSGSGLAICAAGQLGIRLPPELASVQQCLQNSGGDATGTGMCLATTWLIGDRQLTPEQQIALTCVSAPGAASNPAAVAGCVAGVLAAREVDKCLKTPDECLGPNNDLIRYYYGPYVREIVNCLRADQNCFGPNNAFRQALGPPGDMAARAIQDSVVALRVSADGAGRAIRDTGIIADRAWENVIRTLDQSATDARRAVDQGVMDMRRAVDQGVTDTRRAVDQGVTDMRRAVDQGFTDLRQAVEQGVRDPGRAIEQGVADARRAVEQGVADARRAVEQGVTDARRAVEQRATDAMRAVRQGVTDAVNKVDQLVQTFQQALPSTPVVTPPIQFELPRLQLGPPNSWRL